MRWRTQNFNIIQAPIFLRNKDLSTNLQWYDPHARSHWLTLPSFAVQQVVIITNVTLPFTTCFILREVMLRPVLDAQHTAVHQMLERGRDLPQTPIAPVLSTCDLDPPRQESCTPMHAVTKVDERPFRIMLKLFLTSQRISSFERQRFTFPATHVMHPCRSRHREAMPYIHSITCHATSHASLQHISCYATLRTSYILQFCVRDLFHKYGSWLL